MNHIEIGDLIFRSLENCDEEKKETFAHEAIFQYMKAFKSDSLTSEEREELAEEIEDKIAMYPSIKTRLNGCLNTQEFPTQPTNMEKYRVKNEQNYTWQDIVLPADLQVSTQCCGSFGFKNLQA